MNINFNTPFNGKTVAATGKLHNCTRDGIQMKLLSLGAKPSDSVIKKTDYLIAGENAGSKFDKAQSLGIRILSETEFEAMLNTSQEGQSMKINGIEIDASKLISKNVLLNELKYDASDSGLAGIRDRYFITMCGILITRCLNLTTHICLMKTA